jgi:hypothetical protein
MRVHRLDEPAAVRPWAPFVVAALLSTLTVGAISGALDLWTQQVRLMPVPLDHHLGHGLAQVYGLLLLATMGLSLHLVPRFLGGPEVTRGWARRQAWLCLGGLALVISGRLGALLPGSPWLGVAGASLLWVGVTRWLAFVLGAWRPDAGADRLGAFLLAGVGWWWLGTSLLVVWSLGRLVSGPLASLPLEPVYAAGLVGGAGSWIFGVLLRAGLCVLRLERPSAPRQRAMFLGWQLASAGALVAAVQPSSLALLATAAGLLTTLGALRAWRGALRALPGEPVNRRMVQAALAFLGLHAALLLWRASGVAGTPLLPDAARHAYALGFTTLTLFGFAGRMVPGFAGRSLASPGLYGLGALFTGASALARLLELWPTQTGLALAGASGALAALGVTAMAGCLLVTLAPRRLTPAPPPASERSVQRPGLPARRWSGARGRPPA